MINDQYYHGNSDYDQIPPPVSEEYPPYDIPECDWPEPQQPDERYIPPDDESFLHCCTESGPYDVLFGEQPWDNLDPMGESTSDASASLLAQNSQPPFESTPRTRAIRELIGLSCADEAHRNLVDVMNVPCGIGKSSAISEMIGETIWRDNGHGLIVITDDIKRLEDYLNPHNASLKVYLDANREKITLMTASNAAETYQSQFGTPVLLMTTQRFLAMPQSAFARYLSWNGGARPLILIDERLSIREVAIISLDEVNDIATALALGIDNTVNQVEKQWCIAEWETVRTRITEAIAHMEIARPEEPVSSFFYLNPQRCLTSDDDRFMRFIRNNRALLMQYKNGGAYKHLYQIYRIEKDGALYQGRKGCAYSNKLSFAINHRDKLTGLNAKVIILDGTAELHPDYQQEDIRRVDISGYPQLQRRLDHLTIRFINVPTSKRRLQQKENGDRLKQCIANELVRVIGADAKQTPIFTYFEAEKFFRKEGFEKVEHFGDIKGSNKYRNQTLIVQVGLNRCEPLYYETYALYSDSQRIAQLPAMTHGESSAAIRQITDDASKTNDLMNRMVLADIEQNFYRSAIRNADCDRDVEYWVLCNTQTQRDLIEMAKVRYEPLGARVPEPVVLPGYCAMKALVRENEKPSAYQLFVKFMNSIPSGTVFTRKTIIDGSGMTIGQYEGLLRTHPEIRARLDSMAVPGKKKVYRKP